MAFAFAKKALGEIVIKQGLNYVTNEPEKNLANLARWGQRLAIAEDHKRMTKMVYDALADDNNNYRRMALRMLRQLRPEVSQKLLINFFVNSALLGIPRAREVEEKTGVHVPFTMLLDPTGRCNLRCKGCWAAEYDRTKDMDFATLDRVISEAEDLGIHFFVLSGGEPTVAMDTLFKLAEKHDDAVFHVFTNGTLIDREAAKRFAELGNFTFAISLEGLEESTDRRRGKGIFKRVMQAMDNLREEGVLFGFSATYTRESCEEIGSEAFIDLMIEKGCSLGWLFTYVPVGAPGDLDYMATPEQRGKMYETVQRWRTTKPLLAVDFWNDGRLVHGCIAGGRCYFHINATGDVEPCAFVHYSNMNIKDHSLLEALDSKLFRAYQRNQPFNHNYLRPCPIIDNPEALERMVAETGAYSTQNNQISAAQLCRPLHGYATTWGAVADRIATEHPEEWHQTPVQEAGE